MRFASVKRFTSVCSFLRDQVHMYSIYIHMYVYMGLLDILRVVSRIVAASIPLIVCVRLLYVHSCVSPKL